MYVDAVVHIGCSIQIRKLLLVHVFFLDLVSSLRSLLILPPLPSGILTSENVQLIMLVSILSS